MGLYYSTNQAAAPTTPSSGSFALYCLSGDKNLYWKDDAGNARKVLYSGGALPTTITANQIVYSDGTNLVGSASLTWDGTDFKIATNKFTVAAASGNTVVAGTLGVTGTMSSAGHTINQAGETYADGLSIKDTYSSNKWNFWQTGGNVLNIGYNATAATLDIRTSGVSVAGTLGVTGATALATSGGGVAVNSSVDNTKGMLRVDGGAGGLPLYLNATTGNNTNLVFAENDAVKWYVRNLASNGGFSFYDVVNTTQRVLISSTGLAVTGIVTPEADNTRTLGTGALRWSTVYAGTGTINTSDAREKTPVRGLTAAEINASKQLAKEVGVYQWLSAVSQKGDSARLHIGLTVQRAIEIMESNGLSPTAYGFICYDSWADEFREHPAIEAAAATYDDEGNELTPAVEAKYAIAEQTQIAGDRFSFRMDELSLFIARGIDARLSALEAA